MMCIIHVDSLGDNGHNTESTGKYVWNILNILSSSDTKYNEDNLPIYSLKSKFKQYFA